MPGKNLRDLGGRSLIGWAAKAISDAGLARNAILSTDDPAIAGEGRRCGLEVPFLRPAELAGDDAQTVDTVVHALDWQRAKSGNDPDAVLVLQPTSPLRGSVCISSAIELLTSRLDVNSVVSMSRYHLSAKSIFLTNESGVAEAIGNDARSPVYLPNGAIYLTRTVALRKYWSLYAPPIVPLELDPRRTVDIDTEVDWQVAEAFFEAGFPSQAAAQAGDGTIASTELNGS